MQFHYIDSSLSLNVKVPSLLVLTYACISFADLHHLATATFITCSQVDIRKVAVMHNPVKYPNQFELVIGSGCACVK